MIQVFPGSGAHAGHNRCGLLHASVGKDGELQGVGLNQFNGFDGALRILGRDINHDDFGAQILNLAQDGVGGSGGKADVAEHDPTQAGSLHPSLQLG